MLAKSKMLTIMECSWRFDLEQNQRLGFSPVEITRNIRKGLEKSSYSTIYNLYISFLKKYKGSFKK